MLTAIIAAAALAGADTPPVKFEGEVAVVSDYRFRGLSLSDEKPALQVGATATVEGGPYIGVWASSIADYADDSGDTASVELDFLAGWAFNAAGSDFDVGIAAYTYPGTEGLTFVELPLSASRDLGGATVTLGAVFAPQQDALGDEDNRYLYAAVAWEVGPVGLSLQGGQEDGAFAPDGKWDWSATVGRNFGPVRGELSYIGTDAEDGDGGLVAALKVAF